ncbi:MAG: MBL fold metallo-hydrolase [Promethearchaeota archaeon]
MFEYFKKSKKSYFKDYGSFILCRPGKSYKVNANVSIIKDKTPILYDIGLDWNMMYNIKKALNFINKTSKDLKFIIISHFHPDHCLNLLSVRRIFPNSRIIIHKKSYDFLTNFMESIKVRKKSSNIKIINFFTRIIEFLEGYYILQKNKIYTCKDNDFIPGTNFKLKIIHTPGHSSGHICLHDISNKILFLGDHLPLTPWLDISYNSIDNIINSIKKLLNINPKEIKFSVRGHGNLSDNSQEVYSWEDERAKFREHLDLIEESIDKITSILKNRAMTTEELAYIVLKNKDFRDYSNLMNRLFMPPNLTWIICYLLKLKKENKVKKIGKKWIST